MVHFTAPFHLLYHYLRHLSSDSELIVIHGKDAIRVRTVRNLSILSVTKALHRNTLCTSHVDIWLSYVQPGVHEPLKVAKKCLTSHFCVATLKHKLYHWIQKLPNMWRLLGWPCDSLLRWRWSVCLINYSQNTQSHCDEKERASTTHRPLLETPKTAVLQER